jgi:uncharacterized protein YbjT (DUF2867 family)
METILVTGGTGHIGSELVEMLAGARVRVLSRDPPRAQDRLGPAVEIVDGDLTQPESLAAALAGCERAFFLGQAAPGLPSLAASFAAAARSAGTRHIVAISSGTIEMNPRPAIGQWHAALEEAFASSGVATTFLRPDNFATNSVHWAPSIRARSTVFSTHPDGQSVPIHPWDIAAVARVALTQPGHEGKTYTLSGPTVMKVREQVAVIAAELGRTIEVVQVPHERARAGMMERGISALMAEAVLELMGRTPRPTNTVREVTGTGPRSFAAWVKENRATFI